MTLRSTHPQSPDLHLVDAAVTATRQTVHSLTRTTGIPTPRVQAALRKLIKLGAVNKDGSWYWGGSGDGVAP